jgi:4-amino-4-deoxy-L-arabinose transferase-like glycosyltransferase
MQQRMERRSHYQAAGVPIWGVLLILVGIIALLGNFGIGLGWIFGLALGTWFVYLGIRHAQEGGPVNWWLVGLGLLIGLGAMSTSFLDKLIFPAVLILVGLGIMGEYVLGRQNQNPGRNW